MTNVGEINERYKKQIKNFYKLNKRMPSYSEIMEILKFKSKNSVFKLVNKLIEEDFLGKDEKGRLIPKSIFGKLKILGEVVAGFPSPAEEELADTMSLDEYLINNKDATYMLKVSGDSMKDAGIMEGDMVLADRSLTATSGDIVIAQVDNQWTIKYLRKTGKIVFLEPANSKYLRIYPQEELKIAAVVRAVIRKY
ncbi:MAG: LexA family transcriptional regulator [Patescibacteria group bacterium]|jgi:SOS regulatory protein LexA|nr:LexA family transcriptional regulator [Patescibacteria group bacterium]